MTDRVEDPTTPNNEAWEDHSANVLSPEEMKESASDAVLQGQKDAKQNAKKEAEGNDNPYLDDSADQENIKNAQESAELNAKAEVDAQPEQGELKKNDTSKAAKVRTTKDQLDPNGEAKVSEAELTRAATNGATVKGDSGLSNEEAAKRAKEEAEKSSPKTADNK